jgi:hypothetical protein
VHLHVASATAELIMGHDSTHCLQSVVQRQSWVMTPLTVYSQWFKGILNKVTDAFLSHDHDLFEKKLLNDFHSFIPEQIQAILESVLCHQTLS